MEQELLACPSGRQSWAPPGRVSMLVLNYPRAEVGTMGSATPHQLLFSPPHLSKWQPHSSFRHSAQETWVSPDTTLTPTPPSKSARLFLQCTLETGLLDCTGLSPVPFHSPSLVPLPPFLPSIHPIYSQHSSCECEPMKTHQTLSLLCSKPSSGPNFKVKAKV